MIIKRIDPVSAAKVAAVLYGGMGFIFGAFMAVMSLAASGAAAERPGPPFGALFGVGAVVVLPILYGGMGAVMSLIAAFLYNLVAGLIGGIRIETE